MIIRKYLIIRANGETRIVTRIPKRLALDEFAYKLNLTIPDAWASVLGEINIGVPDPTIQPTMEISREMP